MPGAIASQAGPGGAFRATGPRSGPSLAGQPQWRGQLHFASTQALLGALGMVASYRHDALSPRKPDMNPHHNLTSERGPPPDEIQLPRPHKAGAVKARHLSAVRKESVAPHLESFRIEQAQ